MSSRQRLSFLAIAVVIAAVAIVVLASGGDDSTTATTPPATTTTPSSAETATATAEPTEATPAGVSIEVAGGEVVGGAGTIEVKQGETARFSVTSDVADEVHVHGYDVKKDVEAGGTVDFEIPAKITGIFEVELEDAGLELASLRVDP